MKRIKTFAELFEGVSQKSKDFKLDKSIPASQEDVDKMMELEEMKNLMGLHKSRYQNGYLGKQPDVYFSTKSGSTTIVTGIGYDFKITRSGKIYYGQYPIGPSFKRKIEDLPDLINFFIVYATAGEAAERFVFDGAAISPSSFEYLERSKFYQIIVDMAKKYNGAEKIDSVIKNTKEGEEKIITDAELIKETETFKKFDAIYGFNPIVHNQSNIQLKPSFYSPYGIAEELLRQYSTNSSWLKISMNLGANGDIKVKTLRGLNTSLKSLIGKYLHVKDVKYAMNPETAPIQWVLNKINGFVFDNIDSVINKEMLIGKFSEDIKWAAAKQATLILGKILRYLGFGEEFDESFKDQINGDKEEIEACLNLAGALKNKTLDDMMVTVLDQYVKEISLLSDEVVFGRDKDKLDRVIWLISDLAGFLGFLSGNKDAKKIKVTKILFDKINDSELLMRITNIPPEVCEKIGIYQYLKDDRGWTEEDFSDLELSRRMKKRAKYT
jgi:hypothetical protein